MHTVCEDFRGGVAVCDVAGAGQMGRRHAKGRGIMRYVMAVPELGLDQGRVGRNKTA